MDQHKLWRLVTLVLTTTVHTHCGLNGQLALLLVVAALSLEQGHTPAFPLKLKLEIVMYKSAVVNFNGPFGVPVQSLALREFNKEREMIYVTTLTLKYKQNNVTKAPVNGINGAHMEPVLNHVLEARRADLVLILV